MGFKGELQKAGLFIGSTVTTGLIAVGCGGGESTPAYTSPPGATQDIGQIEPTVAGATQEPDVPGQSPLELAIENGRLELNGDWEKYFTPITPDEASSLLSQANDTERNNFYTDFRILFPMDPRSAPGLVLQDSDDGLFLQIGNVPVDTIFYSPVNGDTEINAFQGVTGTIDEVYQSIVLEGNDPLAHRYYTKVLQGNSPSIPIDTESSVSIGDPLVSIGTPDTFVQPEARGFQATYWVNVGSQNDKGGIKDLLTKDGKIAFIG